MISSVPPIELPGFFEFTTAATLALGIRYALIAGLAWLLCYVFFSRRWFHRKIIAHLPQSSEVWREVRYSALSLVIFGIVGALTAGAVRQGWTQIYWRIDERGAGWFWLSVVCAIFLHDAYFYWTHRLMHHRRLFRWFHRTHHLSHNPTPWAAYAFDPLEAFVQAAIVPLAITIMPMHPLAFVLFMGWQIFFNVIGHTGYEYNRRWLMDTWLGRFLNTPTNHIMHHEKMRGNYGLYFNFWDRLMRTNHDDYEERFRAVTSRPPATHATQQPVEARS
jgi:sterol desaturase/sphingolipid hydroxylase (fatty acid hydroxylase superfamily)